MDYERLMAETYDAQYAVIRDPSGDRDFYLGLAREAGGPVLEAGCGTGRVLLPIARAGIECVGVDSSAEMLRVLKQAQPPANLSIVQGDVRTLDLPRKDFALALSAFRVFQHFLTVEDQLAALERIRAHLRPGGRFAFDVFDPDPARMAIEHEPESESPAIERDGRRVVRWASVTRDRAAQVQRVAFRYADAATGETLGHEHVEMRWIWRYELEHLLWRGGFEPERWHGGYRGEPCGTTREIVVVARKR